MYAGAGIAVAGAVIMAAGYSLGEEGGVGTNIALLVAGLPVLLLGLVIMGIAIWI